MFALIESDVGFVQASNFSTFCETSLEPEFQSSKNSSICSVRGFVPTNSGVAADAAPRAGVRVHVALFATTYSRGLKRHSTWSFRSFATSVALASD